MIDEDLRAIRRLDDADPIDRLPVDEPESYSAESFSFPEDAPACHTFRSAGVASYVLDGAGDLLGHVLMVEYDDVDPSVPIEDAERLDGPVVVARSSPRSYHLLDLTVRPWDETLRIAREETRSSTAYLDDREDDGRLLLRTFPKVRLSDGAEYKPAPDPFAAFEPDDFDGPVSAPHVESYRQLASENGRTTIGGLTVAIEANADTTGERLVRSEYSGVSDELEAAVWGGDSE
jgi:hypothetical protein